MSEEENKDQERSIGDKAWSGLATTVAAPLAYSMAADRSIKGEGSWGENFSDTTEMLGEVMSGDTTDNAPIEELPEKEVNNAWGEALAAQGRGTDDTIAHVSGGEIIVPKEVLDRHPDLDTAIRGAFDSMGADAREFKVGSKFQKINPDTGQPEFFFKKFRKMLRKALANPITAAVLTAASGGALAPIMGVSTAIGTGIASAGLNLAAGQSLKESATAGLTAGVGSAAAGATGGTLSKVISKIPGADYLSSTLGGTLNKMGMGSTLYDVAEKSGTSLASTALQGALDVPISQYLGSMLTGVGHTPEAPKAPAITGTKPATTWGTSIGQDIGPSLASTEGAPDATGSTKGAGALPGSPGTSTALSGLESSGIKFLAPLRNRETGEIDYSDSPFSSSIRSMRRGGWGGSMIRA